MAERCVRVLTLSTYSPAERIQADAGDAVLARDLAEVDDGLRAGVHAEHRVVAAVRVDLVLLLVATHDELVVQLSPREHVAPVRQVV